MCQDNTHQIIYLYIYIRTKKYYWEYYIMARPRSNKSTIRQQSQEEAFIWIDKDKYPPTKYRDSDDYKRSTQRTGSDISLLHTIQNNNSRDEGTFVMIMGNVNLNDTLSQAITTWADDVINDNDFNEVIIQECSGDCDADFLIDFCANECDGDCTDLK